jgi:hypothetical protein
MHKIEKGKTGMSRKEGTKFLAGKNYSVYLFTLFPDPLAIVIVLFVFFKSS